MNLSSDNYREKEFHNKLQASSKSRFENIFYKAIYNSDEDFFKFIEINSMNSEILDYGCGIGNSIKRVANFNPKKISGIDISEVSIQKAKNLILDLNIKAELFVDNCEKTKFKDNSFNIVYGEGILHHLSLPLCLKEINRILKSRGKFLFVEPLGTNPIINLYRKLTPNSRSVDEHPLIDLDFKLIENDFINVKLKYYGLLTLIFFPFYKSPQNSIIFNFFKNLDQFLFKFKIFQKLAWSVLITAEKT